MAKFSKGETFVDGEAVTGTRLNALVDSANALPGLISEFSSGVTPALSDRPLLYDVSGTALISPTLTDVFAAQVTDAAAGTASLRTLGYTGNKAAPGATTPDLTASNTFTGTLQKVKHLAGTTGASIAADTAGLGTTGTPTADLGTGSSDVGGFISLHTGNVAGGTGVTCAVITFGVTFASAPWFMLVPYNSNANGAQAGGKALTVSATTTQCTITTGSQALATATTYNYQYVVISP
jgi:hypothetical protein